MKKTLLIVILITSVFAGGQTADFSARPEVYFRFKIDEKAELETLTRIVSIDNVIEDTVYAYANQEEFQTFLATQKTYELLTAPALRTRPEMSNSIEKSKTWDSYPSWDVYRDMMAQFQINYPNICRIDSVGHSVNGRAILFAIVSDNVQQEEQEPEVMYTSTMHGDETVGFILMLRLIDELLSKYGTDQQITGMVDGLEIWINPLANPDGTYYSGNTSVFGATRYNANGVDLNRNFPSPAEGEHPDGNSWQPETVAMMTLAERQNFVLSANFHGGAELLNYPWDCWTRRHADDDWLIWLCRQYADTAQARSPGDYLTDRENGITNGWDWYPTYGNRQDYMTYYRHGRELTIELSGTKLVPEADLPDYWAYNRDALLNFLSAALLGIQGQVRSDDYGDIRIGIVGHEVDNSWVICDPDGGDYYRLFLPGVVELEIGNDLVSKRVSNVYVDDNSMTMVNLYIGTGIPGDIDTNGQLDIADAMILYNFISGRVSPDAGEFKDADWNADGVLNQTDLDEMLNYLMNLYP